MQESKSKRNGLGKFLKLVCSVFALSLMLGFSVCAKEVTVKNGDIQAALDEAKNANETVTVIIPEGEYTISRFLYVYPNTTIKATGATIKNNNVGTPIMTWDGTTKWKNVTVDGGKWLSSNGAVIDIMDATDLTLKNMTVEITGSATHFGFSLQQINGLTMEHCLVQGGASAAVLVKGSSNVTVIGGTYNNSQMGIMMDQNDTVTFTQCSFVGNTNSALNLNSTKNCTIDGVVGITNIVVLATETGTVIKNCTIEKAPGNALLIKASGTVIEGNTIRNAADTAIYLEKVTDVVIKNNKIESAYNLGINADGGGKNTISGNTITDSGFIGLRLLGDNGSVIEGNTLERSAVREGANGEGLVVDNASDGTVIRSNIIKDTKAFKANVGNGIIVNRSKNVTVEKNTVENSANHGIQGSYASAGLKVTGNVVKSAGNAGISISRGAQADVADNTISNVKNAVVFDGKEAVVSGSSTNNNVENAEIGIHIENSNVTVKGGRIHNVTKDTAVRILSGTAVIDGVVAYQDKVCEAVGINVATGANATLTNNTVSNFKAAGIFVNQGATVEGNNNKVYLAERSFTNSVAIIIHGTSSSMKSNSVYGSSIESTKTEGTMTDKSATGGVMIDGKIYTMTADGSGSFSVSYPETATDKIALYTKDASGNEIFAGAAMSEIQNEDDKDDSNGEGSGNGSGNTVTEEQMKQISSFVDRIYNVALKRPPANNEQEGWISKLASGEISGAEVAQGFFFSAEMTNKNLNDEEFVDTLYRTMFDREGDPAGTKDWLDALKNGMSREFVYRGFAEGTEFKNLCEKFGIVQGKVTLGQFRDQNRQLTAFVARNYMKALSRSELDEAGVNYWCEMLLTKKDGATPASVVKGFIFSAEFINKNLNDDQFVHVLYETYFDRSADNDADGYNYWMNELKNGKTRSDVVDGFSGSVEFDNLVKSFGL